MKRMTWTLWVSVAGLVLVVSGLVVAGEIPASKDVIVLSGIPGTQPNVKFPHKKHAVEFKTPEDKQITCKTCHHTLKTPEATNETPEPCTDCHVKPGVPQKTFEGKTAPRLYEEKNGKATMSSVLYHKVCLTCHRKESARGKHISGCKTCHNTPK